MNPILELRWKIAMLDLTATAASAHNLTTNQFNACAVLIRDLESELKVQEAIFAKTQVDRDVRENIGLPPRR